MLLDQRSTSQMTRPSSERPLRCLTQELTAGFAPAFRHRVSGEVRICRQPGGRIAAEHRLTGLPRHWVRDWDSEGVPTVLVAAVEPGFCRGPDFWTLGDLLHPGLDG